MNAGLVWDAPLHPWFGMHLSLQPICTPHAPCKCCGTPSPLYGVVDFHKNAHAVLPCAGVPVYYYRCPTCGFIFTTLFDRHTIEDLKRDIYNDQYVLVDPDYVETRPRNNATFLANLLAADKPRILDYGGGTGVLERCLRAAGFREVDTYDPFVPAHAIRPGRRYDCVVSFEVVEHTTDPRRVFADMTSYLTESGVLLFSTLVQPPDIDRLALAWWYVLPRNGHVSLFARASLEKIASSLRFRLASFNEDLHLFFRTMPRWAAPYLAASTPAI